MCFYTESPDQSTGQEIDRRLYLTLAYPLLHESQLTSIFKNQFTVATCTKKCRSAHGAIKAIVSFYRVDSDTAFVHNPTNNDIKAVESRSTAFD